MIKEHIRLLWARFYRWLWLLSYGMWKGYQAVDFHDGSHITSLMADKPKNFSVKNPRFRSFYTKS